MGNELKKRFMSVLGSITPDYQVFLPGHKILSKPALSLGYCDCDGVIFLYNNLIGLSHYNLSTGKPEEYLQEMLDKMPGLTNPQDLEAVIVGGDQNHFERIKKILRNRKIQIKGEYLDSWNEGRENPKGDIKNLVVIPSTKEVIIYSDGVGYKQLSPNH